MIPTPPAPPALSLRERAVHEYMAATQGNPIVGDAYGAQAPTLAEDYLGWLTGRTISVPAHAQDWDRYDSPALEQVASIARFTHWTHGKRAARPFIGDVVVFDNTTYGTVGVFLFQDDPQVMAIYTQSPRPPDLETVDLRYNVPKGWWRVHDHALAYTGQ